MLKVDFRQRTCSCHSCGVEGGYGMGAMPVGGRAGLGTVTALKV